MIERQFKVVEVTQPRPAKLVGLTAKLRLNKRLLIIIGTCLCVALAALFVIRVLHTQPPIPQATQQEAGFPIYYPSPLPSGYQLKPNSAQFQHRILTFEIITSNNTITVNEQIAPTNPPDIQNIPGFNEISILTGQAASGMINNQPTAILLAPTTLITVTGSKAVSLEQIGRFTQSLDVLSN